MSKKGKLVNITKRLIKGDFDFLHSEFITKDGLIRDSHPLQGHLIVFRQTGIDQSKNGKNTVKPVGASNYLLISESTKNLICNDQNEIKSPIKIGYNEINNHLMVLIDCGTKQTEVMHSE